MFGEIYDLILGMARFSFLQSLQANSQPVKYLTGYLKNQQNFYFLLYWHVA